MKLSSGEKRLSAGPTLLTAPSVPPSEGDCFRSEKSSGVGSFREPHMLVYDACFVEGVHADFRGASKTLGSGTLCLCYIPRRVQTDGIQTDGIQTETAARLFRGST